MDSPIETIFRDRLRQLYIDLSKAEERGEFNLDEYSYPFVTYIGRNYCDAFPKIFYVGQAQRGWGVDQLYHQADNIHLSDAVRLNTPVEVLSEIADNFVTNSIETYYGGEGGDTYPHSAFWHWIYKLTVSVQQKKPELFSYVGVEKSGLFSRECFASIAWSNVFKISRLESNPDKRMREFLVESTFNTLQVEIENLDPDLIVFLTGDTYDSYLRQVFPELVKEAQITDGVTAKEVYRLSGVRDRAIVIRGPHPRNAPTEKLSQLYDYLKKQRSTANW